MESTTGSTLTVDDLAKRWHTTRDAIHMQILRGADLPPRFKAGRRWLFRTELVERWEEQQSRKQSE